jgi:4'-phosphopantetheinyl transferase EntD
MIEAVLPPGVVGSEAWGDPADAVLLPEEEALAARAVPRRRRELTTGRHCARRALAQLGMAPGPILSGPRREPLWPDGVVGSITHCTGYRAAAVAWAAQVPTVGIDAEPHEPLPDGVLDTVSLPEERAQLRQLAKSSPRVCWDRLLFCSKEAVYKAWYPHAQAMLDFHEATITVEPRDQPSAPGEPGELWTRTAGYRPLLSKVGDEPAGTVVAGTVEARLLVDGPVVGGRPVRGFGGQWVVGRGLVLVSVTQLR